MFWSKALTVGLAVAVLAACGVGAVAVGYAQAVAAEDKKPDEEKIQGGWKVTEAKKNGQDPADKDEVVGQVLTFDGDRMKFGPFAGEWKLDPSKDPRQIDCTVVDGPENEKGKVSQGIYKLDGDKLTLHLSHPGGERPTSFESKEGENCILLTLERVKK